MSSRHSQRFSLIVLLMLLGISGRLLAQASPNFTPEEKAWIKNHPVVLFTGAPRLAPIEMVVNGRYEGIAAEYLNAISRKSGLRFQFVPINLWSAAQRALLDRKIDLIPNATTWGISDTVRSQVALTEPYFFSPTVVITQSDSPVTSSLDSFDGKTIATQRGASYAEIIRNQYPQITLLLTDSTQETLDAVAEGKAAAAVGPSAVLVPFLRRKYAGILGISGAVNGMPLSVEMGVRLDDPMLYSIIRKSLNSLTAEETDKIEDSVLDQIDYGAPTLMSILRYRLPELSLLAALIALLGLFAYRARVAHRAAEASELAKSRFLAVMSHEIRTPMNAVLASIEMLEKTMLDARQQKLANMAATASEALLSLLDDVLDLSKLDAKRLELEQIPTDVGALTLKVADIVRVRAREKGLPIDVDIHDSIQRDVLIDPTRFRQVLLNLLTNAVKFTDQGSIKMRLEITNSNGDQNDASLSVRVTDTGIGISPEQQASLFQAYTQADSSTTRRYGGTGLGLTICKELVELMGGKVALESAVNVGTTVKFTLPVQLVDRAINAPVSLEQDSPTASLRSADVVGTVLVVDDHPNNQFVMGEQLRDLGVSAVIVSDGHAALEAIQAQTISLVLMDCHMPGMDGYETTRRIREREATHSLEHLPIIAISAATDASHLNQCMESGMDGVLKKPLRLDELRGMLQLWMGHLSPVTEHISQGMSQTIDLASLYKNALFEDVDALKVAFQDQDDEAASRLAHRLRGAALVAHLDAIAHLAEQLETLIDANAQNYHTDALSIVEKIHAEVSKLAADSDSEKADSGAL
jgi:two-component system, NarL family, sensor histidine kinase EvgS